MTNQEIIHAVMLAVAKSRSIASENGDLEVSKMLSPITMDDRFLQVLLRLDEAETVSDGDVLNILWLTVVKEPVGTLMMAHVPHPSDFLAERIAEAKA